MLDHLIKLTRSVNCLPSLKIVSSQHSGSPIDMYLEVEWIGEPFCDMPAQGILPFCAKKWYFPRKRSLYYRFLFIIIIHYKALLSFLLFIGEKDFVFAREKKLVATFSLRLLLCTALSHNTISPTTKLFSNSKFFGTSADIASKY